MRTFIYTNLKIPKEAQQQNVQQNVMVRFTVDENGNVTRAKADPGPGLGCEEEAERVIRAMPLWKPGSSDGRPIAVDLTLPITFIARLERLN
jgi:TonB family protein